jgi:F-type H+-transporting ATPase subunit delta
MIQVGKTARRYARALFEATQETPKAKVENIFEELQQVLSLVRETDEALELEPGQKGLFELLAGNELVVKKRLALFDTLLGKTRHTKLVRNFFALIIERGRFGMVPEIIEAYRQELFALTGKSMAVVKSPADLTAEQQDFLREQIKQLTGREVELAVEQQPDLLGGVRIEVAGTIYDFSLQAQLDELCRQLVQ